MKSTGTADDNIVSPDGQCLPFLGETKLRCKVQDYKEQLNFRMVDLDMAYDICLVTIELSRSMLLLAGGLGLCKYERVQDVLC